MLISIRAMARACACLLTVCALSGGAPLSAQSYPRDGLRVTSSGPGDRVAFVRSVSELPPGGLTPTTPADWAVTVRDLVTGEETELFRTGLEVAVDGGEAVQLTVLDAVAAPAAPPAPDPPASQEAPSDLSEEELETMAKVVGYFAARAEAGQVVCLSFLQDPRTILPAPDALVERAERRWSNVTTDACPRTYARAFTTTDSLGQPVLTPPPPGHVDPSHLSVGRPEPTDDGGSRVDARVRRGTGGRAYRCLVSAGPGGTTPRCRLTSTWVS